VENGEVGNWTSFYGSEGRSEPLIYERWVVREQAMSTSRFRRRDESSRLGVFVRPVGNQPQVIGPLQELDSEMNYEGVFSAHPVVACIPPPRV